MSARTIEIEGLKLRTARSTRYILIRKAGAVPAFEDRKALPERWIVVKGSADEAKLRRLHRGSRFSTRLVDLAEGLVIS